MSIDIKTIKFPIMMKEFCLLCDVSKNRLIKALQSGVIDVGTWVEHNKQQVRYFSADDLKIAREYFNNNWGRVTLEPRGEEVRWDPRYKTLEQAAAIAGVHSRTIIENEKRRDLPPPKWVRKPFPKRVYGYPEIRRIVHVLKGEDKVRQWELDQAEIPTIAEDDIDDGVELTFDK